jgi:putative acetyltransferase
VERIRAIVTTTIRPETGADRAAVREIVLGAFDRTAEADLVDSLRGRSAFIPGLSLVAEQDGKIGGYILFTHVTLNNERAGLLGLGPVAVLPDLQGKGVGNALIREGLRLSAELGFDGVVLVGNPRYYGRYGFVPASRFGLRSPFRVLDDVFQAMPLRAGGLDGVNGTVRYAPEFDQV